VRNTIDLKYGNNSALEVSAVDPASVGLYGQLAQIFTLQPSNTRPMLKIRPIFI
jgi:hypothetical protein